MTKQKDVEDIEGSFTSQNSETDTIVNQKDN